MNRALRTAALMLAGVAVWETVPAQAQYGAQVKVPLYGAYYGGDSPAAPANDDRLAAIEKKLDDMAKQLAFVVDAVRQAQAAAAEPARGQADPEMAAALQVCAKCHRAGVADTKGGGFAMFSPEGRFTATTPKQLRNIVSRVNSPDALIVMPPPKAGQLTPAQKKALTDAALADIAAEKK